MLPRAASAALGCFFPLPPPPTDMVEGGLHDRRELLFQQPASDSRVNKISVASGYQLHQSPG